jgi:hypothetical protein
MNLYEYASSNPINRTDPGGTDSENRQRARAHAQRLLDRARADLAAAEADLRRACTAAARERVRRAQADVDLYQRQLDRLAPVDVPPPNADANAGAGRPGYLESQ